jgi:hypothetical protein
MLSLRSRRDDRATKGMRNISSSTRSHKFAAGCDLFVDRAPASYLTCRRETNLSEIPARPTLDVVARIRCATGSLLLMARLP